MFGFVVLQTGDDLPQFSWRPMGDLSENVKEVEDIIVVYHKK